MAEHFTFAKDEARDGFSQVESDGKSGRLPTAAYDWIVRHFSRAGDYVIHLCTKNAAAVMASMQNSRHAIYFGKEEDQETVRCQLASQVQPRKARDV